MCHAAGMGPDYESGAHVHPGSFGCSLRVGEETALAKNSLPSRRIDRDDVLLHSQARNKNYRWAGKKSIALRYDVLFRAT